MRELTRAEEQVMQILWDLDKAFVKEIVEKFADPKPAYNTVSNIIRILKEKGFVDHEILEKVTVISLLWTKRHTPENS